MHAVDSAGSYDIDMDSYLSILMGGDLNSSLTNEAFLLFMNLNSNSKFLIEISKFKMLNKHLKNLMMMQENFLNFH